MAPKRAEAPKSLLDILKNLAQGLGLARPAAELYVRLGSQLQRACGVESQDDPQLCKKVITHFEAWIATLPAHKEVDRHRLVAWISYNLPNNLPKDMPMPVHVADGELTIRRQWYEEFSNKTPSDKTIRRDLEDYVIPHLEACVRDALRRLPTGRRYVLRPQLELECEGALADDASLILLYGEPGTGKSWLAQRAARTFLGLDLHERVPTINAQTDDLLNESLSEFLEDSGVPPKKLQQASPKRRFRDWLSSPVAQPLVVLDNVESQVLLEALMPERPHNKVIVTSRRQLKPSAATAAVHVGNLEATEARELALSRVPSLTEDGSSRVAEELGYRALAIEHGCACLREKPYNGDVDVFCRALRRNVAAVLESFGEEEDGTLTAIYKMIVAQLQQHPQALRLLDLLAFLGPYIPRETTLPLLWSAPRSSPGGETSATDTHAILPEDQGALNKAIRILTSRNLCLPDEGLLHMHELTRRIVSHVRDADGIVAAMESLHLLSQHLQTGHWSGGRPLPVDWPLIAPILLEVFRLAVKYDREAAKSPEMWDLLAIAVRQYRQEGDISAPLTKLIHDYIGEATQGEARVPTSLDKEALELQMLIGRDNRDGAGSVLAAVREVLPDAPSYEMIFRDDCQPIIQECGYTEVVPSVVYFIRLFERLLDPVEVARHSYALGVILSQTSHWQGSAKWLEHSYGLYQRIAESKPEFGFYAAESARRLVELHIRTRDVTSQDRFLGAANDAWQVIRANGWRTDRSLELRMVHTSIRLSLEATYWMLASTERRNKSVDALAEDLNDLLHALGIVRADYERLGLTRPLMRAHFDLFRVGALMDPRRSTEGLLALAEVYRSRRWGAGAALCELALLKLALDGAPTKTDLRSVRNAALRLADRLLRRYHSPYWRADALCVALAAANQYGGPSVAKLQGLARRATSSIQRKDKLYLAEEVGNGALAAVLLLSE